MCLECIYGRLGHGMRKTRQVAREVCNVRVYCQKLSGTAGNGGVRYMALNAPAADPCRKGQWVPVDLGALSTYETILLQSCITVWIVP